MTSTGIKKMDAKVFAELLWVLLRHIEKMSHEDRLSFEANIVNIGGKDYNCVLRQINNLRIIVENWIDHGDGRNMFELYLTR
jgi:hypothetical protein